MVPALTEGQRIISGMANILRLFVARVTSVALIFLASAVVAISTPFLPGNNTAYALFTVGLPTFALALWARPRNLTDGRLHSIAAMTAPAAALNMIFGILVFVAAYALAIDGLVSVTITPEQFRSWEELLGFTLPNMDAARQVAAGYIARSAMTALLVFNGCWLIVLSEPPTQWLAVLSPKSDDIKSTLLATGFAIAFVLVMATPFAQSHFEMAFLPLVYYIGLAFLSLVWLLAVRFLVKKRFFQRFLERVGVTR